MALWTLSFLCFFYGMIELKPWMLKFQNHFQQSKSIVALRYSIRHLKLLQEMLESGLVPERQDWDKVLTFQPPWGSLLHQSISELRRQGAAILPTLRRMQRTLEEQTELILEGKVKSAQAFGQAILGIALVPVFSFVLYFMLPEVRNSLQDFVLLVLFAFFLSGISLVWMISMIDGARFGGIRVENRKWLVSVNMTLERILALISTGLPPDLAWKKSIEELAQQDRSLAQVWSAQVWTDATENPAVSQMHSENQCERLMIHLGTEIRRSIQTSLLEGRPCLDRIESIHRAYLLDLRMKIGQELSLLPNRCLKPLFIFVLPSVLLILFGSLYLTVRGLIL